MTTVEMKIKIPKVNGGRLISAEMRDGYLLTKFEIGENLTYSISESELECRIDPNTFEGEWLEHKPTTKRQKEMLALYQDAKAKDRLHAFTCMTIDASVENEKVLYKKGLEPETSLSILQWENLFKACYPSRNSRLMTRTEYVCRNLFLIRRMVEVGGYKIEDAWESVCDDSKRIGNYCNSEKRENKSCYEPTGSREVCGFYDLANAYKLLAKDPWEKNDGYLLASGGSYYSYSDHCPVAAMKNLDIEEYDDELDGCVGMLALD